MSELKYIPFEEESPEIKTKVEDYWTERADSFFDQKKHELESKKAKRWLSEILAQIEENFGARAAAEIKILDVGCGAGFFTVLLAKEGFDVTGIDLTEKMVSKAGIMIEVCSPLKGKCHVMNMDAEHLNFADESFDVIVSRNLTWTLPHPVNAYEEWARVLKSGGVLINFDAEYAKGAHYLNNQDNPAHRVVSDELKNECHEIYHMLTISSLDRPEWDEKVLELAGFGTVKTDTEFYKRIYGEKDEFYIPDKMFMIVARK